MMFWQILDGDLSKSPEISKTIIECVLKIYYTIFVLQKVFLKSVLTLHDSFCVSFIAWWTPRGARDVKNYTGSVNFFKALGLTPLPQKRICQTEKGNFQKKHISSSD